MGAGMLVRGGTVSDWGGTAPLFMARVSGGAVGSSSFGGSVSALLVRVVSLDRGDFNGDASDGEWAAADSEIGLLVAGGGCTIPDTVTVGYGHPNDLNPNNLEIRYSLALTNDSAAPLDLSRVTINSPIDGLITKRNVEEGETAMAGFTNNPSVVLLIVADMSIIEAEIEVDETDIPNVKLGQSAKVTIDALPDKTFTAKVTEIGNSPINATTTSSAVRQATTFKVVVTLDGQVPEVRPGFTCTADITTATRENAVAVPIQALTVRQKGDLEKKPEGKSAVQAADTKLDPAAEKAKKEEIQGVFVVNGETVQFRDGLTDLGTPVPVDSCCAAPDTWVAIDFETATREPSSDGTKTWAVIIVATPASFGSS